MEPMRQRCDKAIEPLRGGERVEQRLRGYIARNGMFSVVLEHVNECIPHLTRARQSVPMPAVRPEPTTPKQHTIHAPSDANHEDAL